MAKQRLEGHFRTAITKYHQHCWLKKLQTFPGAHTKNEADFLMLTEQYRYLVECKETIGNRFEFSRFTQREDMINFVNCFPDNNRAYLLICFWRGRKTKSYYYLIPVEVFSAVMRMANKKSLNIKDFEIFFSNEKIDSFNEIFTYFK